MRVRVRVRVWVGARVRVKVRYRVRVRVMVRIRVKVRYRVRIPVRVRVRVTVECRFDKYVQALHLRLELSPSLLLNARPVGRVRGSGRRGIAPLALLGK